MPEAPASFPALNTIIAIVIIVMTFAVAAQSALPVFRCWQLCWGCVTEWELAGTAGSSGATCLGTQQPHQQQINLPTGSKMWQIRASLYTTVYGRNVNIQCVPTYIHNTKTKQRWQFILVILEHPGLYSSQNRLTRGGIILIQFASIIRSWNLMVYVLHPIEENNHNFSCRRQESLRLHIISPCLWNQTH